MIRLFLKVHGFAELDPAGNARWDPCVVDVGDVSFARQTVLESGSPVVALSLRGGGEPIVIAGTLDEFLASVDKLARRTAGGRS